jgi:hypothetical protein
MWTMQSVGATAFVSAYLAVQIAVPVHGLLKPGPSRFSWEMFANPWRASIYSVVENGEVRRLGNPVETGKVAMMRGDVEFDKHLPHHLCRELPNIEAVIVQPASGPEQMTRSN